MQRIITSRPPFILTIALAVLLGVLSSRRLQSQPPAEQEQVERDEDRAAPRHEIVFAGHSDPRRSDYDLWRIAPDGSQLASLVSLPGHQTSFAISPDGEQIAYSSRGVEGAADIWLRGFERGKPVNLTNHPASDSGPCFSPDGKHLAFFSNRDEDRPELYLLHLDSGDLSRLTENKQHDSGACWTPDGKHILFTRFFPAMDQPKGAGDGEIVILELETGAEQTLTQLGGYNGGLDVSPDGLRVAFHRTDSSGAELWTMDISGQNASQLTRTAIEEYSPAWSPDGEWLVYTAGRGSDAQGRYDLWLMRSDGSEPSIISKLANTQMEPSWRPGKSHAY